MSDLAERMADYTELLWERTQAELDLAAERQTVKRYSPKRLTDVGVDPWWIGNGNEDA
jgi:hypothetical protein